MGIMVTDLRRPSPASSKQAVVPALVLQLFSLVCSWIIVSILLLWFGGNIGFCLHSFVHIVPNVAFCKLGIWRSSVLDYLASH